MTLTSHEVVAEYDETAALLYFECLAADDIITFADRAALVLQREPWRASAAYKGMVDLMFPRSEESCRAALTVCAGCIVRHDCLDAALRDGDHSHGVRGGLTPQQRRDRLGLSRRPSRLAGHEPDVADRYRGGASLKTLANHFDCSVSTIVGVLDGAGVQRRGQAVSPPPEPTELSQR